MTRGKIHCGTLVLAAGLALVLGLGVSFPALAAKEVTKISADALNADLGKTGLTIIDVRSSRDWAKSDEKIKGAVREDPHAIDWAKKYAQDQDIVLYCG